MSSADLNSGNNSSDRPHRSPSPEELIRVYGNMPPQLFFNDLRRNVASINRVEVDRAVFLFQRVRRARNLLRVLFAVSVAIATLPFACFLLPEQTRLGLFFGAFAAEVFLGFILSRTHAAWNLRRKDYAIWLRFVYRRAIQI